MSSATIHHRRRAGATLLATALVAVSILAQSPDPASRVGATVVSAQAAAAASPALQTADPTTAVTGGDGDRRAIEPVSPAHRSSDTPHGKPSDASRAKPRTDKGLDKGYVAPAPGDHEDEEEVQNGEAKNGYSTKQLTYRGGAVQTAPRIYLVFWGANWFTGGDPNGVANRLNLFYGGVGGSSYANVLKQFSSNYGVFSNPTGQYKGWLQDKTSIPAHPTKTDIANAAKRAAKVQGDYSYNAQYIIALPWGYVDTFSVANSFCAWHDWTLAPASTTYWITYTSLPYIPYEDYLGRGCGKGRVNGTNGVLDGVTILASHEYVETVNNPSLNAWLDADNHENGDKCSWVNLQNRQLANGYWFPVQPYWSNDWRIKYNYGCYYS